MEAIGIFQDAPDLGLRFDRHVLIHTGIAVEPEHILAFPTILVNAIRAVFLANFALCIHSSSFVMQVYRPSRL